MLPASHSGNEQQARTHLLKSSFQQVLDIRNRIPLNIYKAFIEIVKLTPLSGCIHVLQNNGLVELWGFPWKINPSLKKLVGFTGWLMNRRDHWWKHLYNLSYTQTIFFLTSISDLKLLSFSLVWWDFDCIRLKLWKAYPLMVASLFPNCGPYRNTPSICSGFFSMHSCLFSWRVYIVIEATSVSSLWKQH